MVIHACSAFLVDVTMTSVSSLLPFLSQLNWTLDPLGAGPKFFRNQSTAENWTQQTPRLHIDPLNDSTFDYLFLDCNELISIILIIIFCVFGFLGNFITILVLRRVPDKDNATIWLLQALAVVDNIYLLLAFLQLSGRTIFMEIPEIWDVLSHIAVFQYTLFLIAHTLTVWIVVLVTIDRYLAICKPMHINWRTLRRMKVAVLWLTILAVLLNTPVLLDKSIYRYTAAADCVIDHIKQIQTTDSDTCLTLFKLLDVLWVYKIVLYSVIRGFVPLMILIVLNVQIARALRALKKKHRRMTLQINRERAITKMLAVVVGVFFVCQMPKAAQHILDLAHVEIVYRGWACVSEISDAFLALNSAINFLIYCLLSTRFSRILRSMFSCRRRQRTVSLIV